MEARPQRLRHHLRRPPLLAPSRMDSNAPRQTSYTNYLTDPRPNALIESVRSDEAVFRSVGGLVGVSRECPAAVRLASERSDHPARSCRGVARKRNGIDTYQVCPLRRTNHEHREHNMFIIGIDPHKGSHTAVAVDRSESVVDTIRVDADRHQRGRLLEWATRFEPRTWAVEGATGMGALLAQQLVGVGEHVVDVPAKLSARVRLLERGRIDKTDPNDARSAAIVAWRTPALNVVTSSDEHTVVLRLLADRDHQITAQRTRSICRLHALLCLLIEGGTGRSLTVARATNCWPACTSTGRSRSSGSPPHVNCSTRSAPSTQPVSRSADAT